MQHLSQRRIIQSITAAFVLAAGFVPHDILAQKKSSATSTSITRTVSVNIQPKDEVVLTDGRVVYNTADQNAQYPGDLQTFLVANLRYPEAARKQKIEGKSVVKFIVASDGSVSDAQIARSSGNILLDEEALRVIGLMGKWKPGMREGSPVAVFYHLPISYKLD